MAWGDSVAGLLRATICQSRVASNWPTIAMLGTCLAAAALFQPYWIAAVGAVAATIAERKRPRLGDWWDDNLNVVAASLTVMGVLARVSV